MAHDLTVPVPDDTWEATVANCGGDKKASDWLAAQALASAQQHLDQRRHAAAVKAGLSADPMKFGLTAEEADEIVAKHQKAADDAAAAAAANP